MGLSPFQLGKLKIAAHVREELDRANIAFEAIRCRSDGVNTRPSTAKLTVTVNGTPSSIELSAREVEDCESIVAGEVWYRIAQLIEQVKQLVPRAGIEPAT